MGKLLIEMGQPRVDELEFYDDRVLILPEDEEVKTSSGIIIPQTAQEKPKRGFIVIKGEGISTEFDRNYKVGDKVLYGKYAGSETEFKDSEGTIKEYLIVRETDIFCKIKTKK